MEAGLYQIRRKDDHFRFKNQWLEARWHFSFSHYYDPENINFGPLRVLNEDVIDGDSGFPIHGHREMEIVTVLKEGTLSHYDSRGSAGHIVPGEVQKMSAGRGIQHSEWNYQQEPVKLLQIWFTPGIEGLDPSYAQAQYEVTPAGLTILGSPNGVAGGVPIYQDVVMAIGDTDGGFEHDIAPGRGAYVHVVSGEPAIDGEGFAAGDAVRVSSDHDRMRFVGSGRVLILDVPLAQERQESTLLTPEALAS